MIEKMGSCCDTKPTWILLREEVAAIRRDKSLARPKLTRQKVYLGKIDLNNANKPNRAHPTKKNYGFQLFLLITSVSQLDTNSLLN